MAEPKSFDELYEIYKNEAQARKDTLTDFSEGSINDVMAGSSSTLAQELVRLMLDKFKITYFQGAEEDDLEFLATDHFGDTFARPEATKSVGIVEFTRPNNLAGNVLIDAGTFVKTAPDANGESQRFSVILPVTMTGLTINASVVAVEAGTKGDVAPNTITVIESALSDPTITVDNSTATSGGEAEQDDPTYRDTILKLIQGLKGATKEAVLATAQTVPGVVTATAQEFIQTVIEWNEATLMPIGEAFKIARTKLYIADANGTANSALITNVREALFAVRACGVFIDIFGATATSLDWDASITLNGSGPNFATLSTDPQMIVDSMTKYIQDLAIGGNFNRNLARAFIMGIWGPAGSNDLTDFVTNVPAGDITVTEDEKLIPGSVSIS